MITFALIRIAIKELRKVALYCARTCTMNEQMKLAEETTGFGTRDSRFFDHFTSLFLSFSPSDLHTARIKDSLCYASFFFCSFFVLLYEKKDRLCQNGLRWDVLMNQASKRCERVITFFSIVEIEKKNKRYRSISRI